MIILRNKAFSWFDKTRDFLDKLNKKVDPQYKTQKEVLEERSAKYAADKKKKKEELDQKISEISRQHKIALQIQKEADEYLPEWGDGDEYPSFFVRNFEDMDDFGNISLGFQNYAEYHWTGKYWEEIKIQRTPRRVTNLKQDILKNLKEYKKEYAGFDDLDDEDREEVLTYLDHLIGIVNKSSL